MKQRMQKGFTLIELMIVVAIIGILAAVAVPQYQDYTIRSQISEGVTLANEQKTAINDFYAEKGRFATAATSYGLLAAASYTGTYVSAITTTTAVGAAVVNVTYGNKVSAKVTGTTNNLTIRAGVNTGNNLVWVCGNAAAPASTTIPATAANTTTVKTNYMPTSCRA